jgi:hypothetical protein
VDVLLDRPIALEMAMAMAMAIAKVMQSNVGGHKYLDGTGAAVFDRAAWAH